MAKKPAKRRQFRRYIRGSVDHKLQLGTLAPQTLVGSSIADVVTEKAFLSSLRASWSLDNFTPGANIGPILVGIAHSDYSDAEVEEWLESTTNWNQGDKVAQEQGRRKARIVGQFEISPTGAASWVALNDGRQTTTKAKWQLITGQTVKIWAYNAGSAAVATTDPQVRVQGHANLWPN